MTTVNTEIYDALVSAGADETKAREAAKSVAQYDRDMSEIRDSLAVMRVNIAEIRRSLRIMQWMFGFTLAFVVALTWRAFQ